MRRLTQQAEVCILIIWALMLMHSTAEREYFYQTRNLTWNEARNHCKVCFKELVTLTHDNIQIIASKLTSDSWIGLRKNLYSISNSTNNSTGNLTSDYTSDYTSNYTSNYTSDYTGNDTSSSSMPWKQWSNGDLLTFQNWYPGQPVFKSSHTQPSCCSCSCTCPALMNPWQTSFTTRNTEFTTESSFTSVPDLNMTNVTSFTSVPDLNMTNMTSFTSVPDLNMTNMTSFTSVPDLNMTNVTSFTSVPDQNMTNVTSFTSVPDQNEEDFTTMAPPLLVEGECVCSPMLLHTALEPDENYIEDSCVAILSFGPWVEKSCSDLLPFFCYEDRFFGHVNVTNVTRDGASLSWLPAPDGISHYRVEVTGDIQITVTQTNLTADLFNLTAGTLYSVQVIPVKCERDLNPQEVSFYTIPNKVRNLTVTKATEKSVFLMWNKPAGNLSFYLITVDDERTKRSTKEGIEFDGLIPGSLYTFAVLTGVRDNITLSEVSSISTYTRPGKVANLSVTENTNISLLLSWMPPEGNATSFCVRAVDGRNDQLFDQDINYNSTQTWQQLKVTGLPMGSRITLNVTALVNRTLKGDSVTIVSYTAPGPISNLRLRPTHNSLSATWTPSPGNCSNSTVIVQLDGETVITIEGLTEPAAEVSPLKSAAKYTVIVSCVSGHLHSPQVKRSKFTLPSAPTDAKGVSANKSHITFQWKAPENTTSRTWYAVRLSSSFWGYNCSVPLIYETTYTFGKLKSGTNYMFEVRTVTEEAQSLPSTTSHFTESEEMEISLSMMCSSTESLLCANATSEESIIRQLQAHFSQSLGNAISWNLKKQEREDTTK